MAEAGTLEEAFAALFFEAETLDNGDVSGLRFSGKIDDWFDDLDMLWSRLAPFVHAGSFLEFEIEEGALAMGIQWARLRAHRPR